MHVRKVYGSELTAGIVVLEVVQLRVVVRHHPEPNSLTSRASKGRNVSGRARRQLMVAKVLAEDGYVVPGHGLSRRLRKLVELVHAVATGDIARSLQHRLLWKEERESAVLASVGGWNVKDEH